MLLSNKNKEEAFITVGFSNWKKGSHRMNHQTVT